MNMFWVVFSRKTKYGIKTKAQILAIKTIELAEVWANHQLAINNYMRFTLKPYKEV